MPRMNTARIRNRVSMMSDTKSLAVASTGGSPGASKLSNRSATRPRCARVFTWSCFMAASSWPADDLELGGQHWRRPGTTGRIDEKRPCPLESRAPGKRVDLGRWRERDVGHSPLPACGPGAGVGKLAGELLHRKLAG